jgi:predicted aspartyl protease
MILIDIEIWNEIKKEFEVFEGLVDTGATYCVVEKSIAERLGLPSLNVLHLWQMGDALNVPRTIIRVRYGKKEYKIESLIVEIKTSYKRPILPEEKCMRPESPHPLTNRIVVGKSFLDKLTKEEYRKLFM